MSYKTLRSIVRFIMRIITRIKVQDIDKLPGGNLIIAANHLGRLDTAVLLCVLDREDIIMPIAEKYKNHPLFGMIGRSKNGIWLNRFEADFSAMRKILERMKQGGVLVIAPEGPGQDRSSTNGEDGSRFSRIQKRISHPAGGAHRD
jgi:1-acyl-sn-glycerol-3-phosphate acyltransferase